MKSNYLKPILILMGAALLIISGVMLSLLFRGGALKPAGVIKPAHVGTDPLLIGKQVATRLYPDFHAAKFVLWRLEGGSEFLEQIPAIAFAHYGGAVKPTLHDLRLGRGGDCVENCWFVLGLGEPLPEAIREKMKGAPVAEVYVQYFDRDEDVPALCDSEKILTWDCVKPIAVREVRRKLKTPARYFFMQRYHQAQFFLFIEKPRPGG